MRTVRRGTKREPTWNRKNTFNDLIDVAEFLVSEGYTRPEVMFARGGSEAGCSSGPPSTSARTCSRL